MHVGSKIAGVGGVDRAGRADRLVGDSLDNRGLSDEPDPLEDERVRRDLEQEELPRGIALVEGVVAFLPAEQVVAEVHEPVLDAPGQRVLREKRRSAERFACLGQFGEAPCLVGADPALLEEELGKVVLRVFGNHRNRVAAEKPDGAAPLTRLENEFPGAALAEDQAGEFGEGVVFDSPAGEIVAHAQSS
jgi:hypothetical protein